MIEVPSREDILHVAERMTARHRAEILAVSNLTEADLPAALTDRFHGFAVGAYLHGAPVAIGGIFTARPNVASLGFFSTNEFPRVAKSFTRFLRDELFVKLKSVGVHRIECAAMAEFTIAHRWIGLLGLQPEAQLRQFGRGGEDFTQFAWVSGARPPGA